MALICKLKFRHTQFDYDPDSNIGTAEISELKRGVALWQPMMQVWDDAIDEGFILIGKTGAECIWTLATIDYLNDGPDSDIAGWRFAPYIRNWNAASQTLKDLRLLIIND